MKLTGAFLVVCGVLSAQGLQNQPVYRVTVTARTAKAISYQHRSGSTKIYFRGTELLPGASGQAKVEGKQGRMQIEVEFDGLQPATRNGAEYLTYVLWAVTPEGRTANLGEVLLNGTKSKLEVTTELQVFALVVTAEPYYAVRQPSDLIVMENVVRADTAGKIEEVDAKYELLQRGEYQRLANPLALKMERKLPLELYEARNAVQIARAVGAERFAAETFQKAEKNLSQAEAYQARKAGEKSVAMTAREAVQMAEDSRAIAVKRQEDEALSAERQGSAEREIRAQNGQAAAQSETDRVTREAEAARIKARAESERLTQEKDAQTVAASSEAVRVKRDSDARLAAAAADADRQRIDSDARMAAAATDADRQKRESDARLAAAATDADRQRIDSDARMAAAATDADRQKRESDARLAVVSAGADQQRIDSDSERTASQAALDTAAKQTARLERERVELRTLLLTQFNAILQTRDTARGLIVNIAH